MNIHLHMRTHTDMPAHMINCYPGTVTTTNVFIVANLLIKIELQRKHCDCVRDQ